MKIIKEGAMTNVKQLRIISWVLMTVVLALALAVWMGERLNGKGLTLYSFFPLLGLAAFSIMWTHYVLGSVRRKLGAEAKDNKTYFKYSSWLVLGLILLHPGLLIYQLKVDGYGLPPNSYFAVYGEPIMKGAIMLGTISLIIFLLYELRSKFYKKLWWKFVDWAQIVAMFLIFYHGLTLGRELSVGWYKMIWFLYGLSLISAILYNHWYDRTTKMKENKA